MVESSGVPGLAFARASRRAEPPRPNAFLEECSRETTGLCGPSRRLLGLLSGGFMRDRPAEGQVCGAVFKRTTQLANAIPHIVTARTTRDMAKKAATKANATQNATAPAELRKLAVQAVKHKATIDDANFKKRELRETLVRLQEALEERRAEERRIAEEARRREEEAARLAAEEEARRRAEEERLAAEAEAEESEESEEEEDEPEPEEVPEADEEESSEEEEDADELMPEPTLRGRVAPGMVPFMARAAARPMPPAPRRKALPPPPPVVAVTPESESESEEEEEKPVKVECDEASAEEIESEDEEEPEDEVEEEDAIVEVTRRPARRGYPEPSFEGLEALRAAPKDYHELAAALASSGASIEGGDRPLLEFRRDLISSARVAAVTITASKTRNRNIEIDEDGDIAAQTAAAVREAKAATKALNPIKARLRAFEGRKISVPGGRVSIGVSREAVYGYALFVDRGVWNRLGEEAQDACVDAGIIELKGAAAASVALTVRSIGEAPPVPRKRAAPKKSRKPAKKGKLSAVVRAKRGVTYYK